MEKGKLNNGKTIIVTPDIYEEAANDFSEGNEGLRKLLMYCFENNIRTIGCCSGHDGETQPYIAFEYNENNKNSRKAILKILKNIKLGNKIESLIFTKQPRVLSHFSINMEDKTSDAETSECFERVLTALQDEKEVEVTDLNENRQSILNSVTNHKIPNAYFEIQEDKDAVTIILGPQYGTVVKAGRIARPWREDTFLVEYLKGQDASELTSTLHSLEVATKYHACIEDLKLATAGARLSKMNDLASEMKKTKKEDKQEDIEHDDKG